MSEPAPEQHPFERFREAMKELVKVPKAQVLKREKEEKEARRNARKHDSADDGRNAA